MQTQDAMVSRRHARIYWDGNYWIEDLGSSNGVYVGNDKVQKAPFRPGDTVTCGSLVLRLMPDTSPRIDRQHGADVDGHASAGAHGPSAAASVVGDAGRRLRHHAAARCRRRRWPPRRRRRRVAATMRAAAARGDVQVGPNAVLRGAVAPPHAMTGAQSSLGEELRDARAAEAQRRVERALEEATRGSARCSSASSTRRRRT